MNIKYTLGAIVSLPLLPIMAYQGKKIRASVPTLPEATGTQGVATQVTERNVRLITIGESTIAGVGVATHEEGFTGTLATTLAAALNTNVTWRVYARNGYMVKRVTAKILPKIEEKVADLIVIGMGGNDAFRLNTPSKFHQNILELIDNLQVKFPNTPIVFTNVPPIKEFPAFTPLIKFTIGNLGEILGEELEKAVLKRKNVYFIAEKITLKGWIKKMNISADEKDFFSDGVHPSKLTYQTWAKDTARFIVENKIILT
jgi:lysophospholipase L1-like esterase